MSLDIEGAGTCSLARELARLTGETVTDAIAVALRERPERERRGRKLRAIAERCSALMAPGPSATERGDLLHDERGLPG